MALEVSVIIPAFNCERYLPAAVESVGRQNRRKIELLIVDDGSTDDTWETIVRLRCGRPEIVPLRNGRRKGPSGARNTALLAAAGKYVAFLDADDIWLPHHLRSGISFLESTPEVDAVFFNFDVVDGESGAPLYNWFRERTFRERLPTREGRDGFRIVLDGMAETLLEESFVHLQALLLRREAACGILFDETLMRQEDRDFTLRLALDAGVRFAFKDDVTGLYRRHRTSLTYPTAENIVRTTDDHIRLYASYLERFSFPKKTVRRIRRTVRERHLSNSYFFRKEGRFLSSAASVVRSLQWGCSLGQIRELLKTGAELGLGSRRRIRHPRNG